MLLILCQFNIHSAFQKLTAYYALDNPRPAYNNDYVGIAPMYDGYTDDELAPEGLTEEANTGGGYYNNVYIYAS